jgi:peptidoglycan hydrolase-like protein with peptidoglycan-binding domain
MMRKIIKITESDLAKIVKKVLNEQKYVQSPFANFNPKNLKFGDRGDDVKLLQQKLMDAGYLRTDSMVPTGYFGKLTGQALKTVLNGLPPAYQFTTKPGIIPKQKTITTQPKTEVPKKQQNITTNDFKDLKISNQVKSQLNYMKSKGYLSNDKFTILDDKNSQVHAFLPGYKLVHTYYVITGKNRGDQLKTQTMTDWVMKNWTDVGAKFFSSIYNQTKNLITKGIKSTENPLQDVANYIDNCYFHQKEWYLQNTPSGVFKRAGDVRNFMNDLLVTTFIEKDYGARFVTWQTCDGSMIPFGFHGTKSSGRLDVLPGGENFSKKQCTNRKMSFGCINFGDADVKEISSFITAGQLSIWLPDASDGIVEIPSSCVSGSAPQKSIMSYDYMTQNYGKGFK